jgi:IMP and pyridine-specific 5'-nucleotidase
LERDPNTDADLNDWALSSSLHVRSTSNVLAETPPTENVSEISRVLSAAHTSDIMDNDDTNNGFNGPQLITFDGDQTLYSDGANFESNPKLANYLYLLLKHGVTIAVVTAAGYEYQTKKYELRLSGLLDYFQSKGLSEQDCDRFYLFGGECNYLLRVCNI